MAQCEVCGNHYDKTFQLPALLGESHAFDSLEWAIYACAPRCAYCERRIMGHGIEANGRFYCCAQCSDHAGPNGMRVRQ